MILRSPLRHQSLLRQATSCLHPVSLSSHRPCPPRRAPSHEFIAEVTPQKRPIIPPSFATAVQSRHLHRVPPIGAYDEVFGDKGIGGMMSPEGFRVAWWDYQQFVVDRMNTLLAKDSRLGDSWQPKDIAISTARDPALANVFNYASMAHNNHFFFQCLSPEEKPVPDALKQHLITSFSSLESLRKTLLDTAAAMFGPGFVWLVQDHNPSPNHPTVAATTNDRSTSSTDSRAPLHFRILTTYLAGSPYPGAHNRLQGVDMNVQTLRSADDYRRQSTLQNSVGAFGSTSRSGGMGGMGSIGLGAAGQEPSRYGGADITPVLCVNMWEHAWMWDHGVAGKRQFLENWWKCVDWEVVWSHCVQRRGPRTIGGRAFAT